jgi:hypothetical protein
MTAVYLYAPDSDTYDTLAQASQQSDRALSMLEGASPVASKWRPVKVVIDKHGRSGDFPSFLPHVPAFSRRALDVLQPVLGDEIEALPLDSGRLAFYAIHVLEVVDCLDEQQSVVKHYPSGGVMSIRKHVFDENCLGQRLMFRIGQAPRWGVYYTDRFKQLLEDAGLEGLTHRQVNP